MCGHMWLIKPLRRWLPVNNTWDSSWRIHTGILSPSSQVCNRHFIYLCSFKRMKKVKISKFSHKYFICYANLWVLILQWEFFFLQFKLITLGMIFKVLFPRSYLSCAFIYCALCICCYVYITIYYWVWRSHWNTENLRFM